ncbi:MAG: DUF1592 domain-containing protein [Acidobacteria bacterium]|nr:DUF1592 domain-containing protein [Acidobacteriota bacterium]
MRFSYASIPSGLLAAALLTSGDGVLGQGTTSLPGIEGQRALVDRYCIGCHDDDTASGGFSWNRIDLEHPEQNALQVERIIKKLRSGMMPPAGASRPDAATSKAFAAALEARIDQAAAANPYVSAPELHRLNRTEYRNSVRDLLGLDVDVSELLPPDATTNGFDNMSEALTITPALMSAYIRAAEQISREAIGDPKAAPAMTLYKVSRLTNQMRHVEGTPFGTRGGISVLHSFPADGEYSFKVNFYYYYTEELVGSALPAQLQGQEIEISVDGERVAVLRIDPAVKESEANYVTDKVKIKAGQRRLAAAFVSKFDGPVQDHYRLIEQTLLDTTISVTPQLTGLPHLQSLAVTGPYNPTGVSEGVSRKKIFTCRSASSSDEERCATQIISELAGKAFRKPAAPEHLESLLSYYEEGRKDGGFESGIRAAIQAILAKPEFIFRFEKERATAAGNVYRISDLELASRLAYFLWSTVPDEELVRAATQGKLQDPVVLEKQVKRMLADPRSEALATNFAGQWLRLSGIKQSFPEALLFPNFTLNLAQSMRREVELLFDHIMRSDRNILELLTAGYTFVDEVLARHYGIQNVIGPRFQRVAVTDPNRQGLLSKAGVLMMTSLASRTSPVSRGKYILEVLLGTPPPPPPPVVPPLKENVDNDTVLSVRERLEAHRANPACSSCHQIMDPIGLALENFDAVGVWRRNDGGMRIDPSGQMYDGMKLDGPISVRKAVLDRSELFISNLTQNLLAYGLGRVLDYRDLPTVRAIQRQANSNNNRFSSFIMGVVTSAPFQMRAATNTAN